MPTQLGKHFWPNFSFVFGLRLDYLSPTIYLTDIFIFLIFIAYFKKLSSQVKTTNKKYLILFGLFLLTLLMGLMGAKNPLAGFYGILKFLEFSFLTFFIIQNFKLLNKTIIFWCFLTGIIFESLLAFLQYFNQASINGIFYFFGERNFNAQTPGIANASINGQLFLRPYATFSHPNALAGFLVVAMLYLLLISSKGKQKILLISIALGTLALVLSLSRTAIFIWLIYLIVLFGVSLAEKYKKQFSKAKLLIVIFSTVIVLAILLLIFQNSFVLQRFLSTKIFDESIVQRSELVGQSFVMFQKSPLLGIGINNFYNNLSFSNSQLNFTLIQPVHNIFLLVLSETGIIGVCVFLYVLWKTFVKTMQKQLQEKRRYLFLLVFSVVFLGLFDHYFLTIQQGQLLFSVVLGTTLAYKKE